MALVETSLPVCVERFVDYPQLGRFTLRDEGMDRNALIVLLVVDFYPRANCRDRKGEYNGGGMFYRLTFASKVTRLIDDRAEELADGVSNIAISAPVGA